MSSKSVGDEFDDTYVEGYTDTSMFNAEDIVRSVEAVSRSRKKAKRKKDKDASARRRFEDLVEEKRLRRELSDWDEDYLDD